MQEGENGRDVNMNIFLAEQEQKALSHPDSLKIRVFHRCTKTQYLATKREKKVRQPTVIYKPFLNSLLSGMIVTKGESSSRS